MQRKVYKIINWKGIIIYLFSVVTYWLLVKYSMVKRVESRDKTQFLMNSKLCVNDLLQNGCKTAVFLTIVTMFFLVVLELNNMFRSNMILQYKNRVLFFLCMVKKIVPMAFALAVLYTAAASLQAINLADSISTNWTDADSIMAMTYGASKEVCMISTINGIIWFFTSIFFTAIVTCLVYILFWYLINPVFGILVMFVLYVMELTTSPPTIKVFLAYIKVDFLKYYFGGFDLGSYLICITFWLVILMTANVLVISRKNIMW